MCRLHRINGAMDPMAYSELTHFLVLSFPWLSIKVKMPSIVGLLSQHQPYIHNIPYIQNHPDTMNRQVLRFTELHAAWKRRHPQAPTRRPSLEQGHGRTRRIRRIRTGRHESPSRPFSAPNRRSQKDQNLHFSALKLTESYLPGENLCIPGRNRDSNAKADHFAQPSQPSLPRLSGDQSHFCGRSGAGSR